MKNNLLKLSAKSRTAPATLSGIVFLNDAVCVYQALDLVKYTSGVNALYRKLDDELVSAWKGAITLAIASCVYANEKAIDNYVVGSCQSDVRLFASSAPARLVKIASLFDALMATQLKDPAARGDSSVLDALRAEVKALVNASKKLSGAFLCSTSDWTTFCRNLPLKFAKERWPLLNWNKVEPQDSSPQGTAALPELYDRLFTDAEFPSMFRVQGFKEEDFVSLTVAPKDIPEVAAFCKQVTSEDLAMFAPRTYVVRTTDIDASRKYLTANVLQPLLTYVESKSAEMHQAMLAAKRKAASAIVVSPEKAAALVEQLSDAELQQLIGLLSKAKVQKPAVSSEPKPTATRKRATVSRPKN